MLHGDVVNLTTLGWIAGSGLGRLLERDHDSSLQSGVDAPRLLKTEPPQIVLLSLLFLTRAERSRKVYVNILLKLIDTARGPRRPTTVGHRE